MNDYLDERGYAWRLIRTAREAHANSLPADDRLTAVLDAAMDAGLDRAALIVELAALGGRLLSLCNPVATDEVCLT